MGSDHHSLSLDSKPVQGTKHWAPSWGFSESLFVWHLTQWSSGLRGPCRDNVQLLALQRKAATSLCLKEPVEVAWSSDQDLTSTPCLLRLPLLWPGPEKDGWMGVSGPLTNTVKSCFSSRLAAFQYLPAHELTTRTSHENLAPVCSCTAGKDDKKQSHL